LRQLDPKPTTLSRGTSHDEHLDARLTHETGWALSAFSSGLVVFEKVKSEANSAQHMKGQFHTTDASFGMSDVVLHDTYIVWNWPLNLVLVLIVFVLILGAAALIKYLFR
jgi:hypothetical protein